ncbi:MAG: hypothetical protein LBS09_02250 [Bacteroidales bacterium]|jgi:16S rRNA processing protein RimM|nr:hypothetical protein [Bacteroidales bacterium]
MKKDTLHLLGKFSKMHGYTGILVLICENEMDDALEQLPELFVSVDGLLVPFPVEKFTLVGDSAAHVKLEFVNTREEAAELVLCEAYADVVPLPTEAGLEQWTGFTVHDMLHGRIGVIAQIENFNGNIVLQVTDGDKETLLSFHPEIVTDIDKTCKILYINAPEGNF